MCGEIFNRNSAVFTRLNALHTADASDLTVFSCLCAFIVILARNRRHSPVKRHHLNKTLRAGTNAHLARTAHNRIYPCNAVANVNCVIGASRNAVTQTYAPVGAVFRSAVKLNSHFTAVNTLINIFFLCILTVAFAKHNRRRRFNLACLNSQNARYCLCGIISAGSAKSGIIRFAL